MCHAVLYPHVSPSEVQFLENVWRQQIQEARRSRLRILLFQKLPAALIDHISDLDAPPTVVGVKRMDTRGLYVLVEEVARMAI